MKLTFSSRALNHIAQRENAFFPNISIGSILAHTDN